MQGGDTLSDRTAESAGATRIGLNGNGEGQCRLASSTCELSFHLYSVRLLIAYTALTAAPTTLGRDTEAPQVTL